MVQEALDERRPPEDVARKVLEGLESAHWGGEHSQNSVAATIALALQKAGEDVTYAELMGLSGSAFRFQVYQPDWCPSAPHPACGYDCIRPLMAAIPYEADEYPTGEADDAARERAAEAARESINRGVPAIASSEEESLIVGYEDEGRTLLLRPYCSWDPGYTPMEGWPWMVMVLRRQDEAPDRRASIVRSLRQAVAMAHAERAPGHGEGLWYACGFKAFELLIEQLRRPDLFDDAAKRHTQMQANGHTYYSLIDARGCAVAYLREVAGEFDADVGEHLLKAADHYEAEVAALMPKCSTEIAPMAWMLEEGRSWDQPMRERQAAITERVLELDRQAIAEIEAALAALG